MALPTRPASSWMQNLDVPSRLLEFSGDDYELYEDDDAFVLTIEMPGFDPRDIEVTWNDGVLNVAAEQEDETRNQRKTYHRRFRVPKAVDDEDISAEYNNGILEVRLPVTQGAAPKGREIEVQA